jgi:two-component system sensor histidine kinase KdpD
VRVDLPADLPLVPIDAVLMEQVFVNLLENAAKYSPPGSPLELRALAGEGVVIVELADRGRGIPPEDLDRIFEKFQRSAATDAAPGVGLGLTICRGIVRAHGGRLWAENRPDGGAVFRFTIPLGGGAPHAADEDEGNAVRDDDPAEES